MFKQVHFKTLATVICAVLSVGITVEAPKADAASFGPISNIYAFGDSYSDNGALFQISIKAVNAGVPGASVVLTDPALGLYDAGGRWTNGLTAVEVLSQDLHANLTHYAVSGAKTGNGNYFTWLDSYQNTGLFGQIDQYKAGLQGQVADPNALYFIFASANDFFQSASPSLSSSEVQQLADQAVSNIEESVSKLAALGAKQFLVVNSSDIAALPLITQYSEVDGATQYRDSVNALLPQGLNDLGQQLGVEIAEYDHTAISNKIRSNPGDYGLVNLNDPCQPVDFGVKPVCSTPDQYYFWDEVHPTRRVHQIIGDDMAQFVASQEVKAAVPESSTVLGLFALGLIGTVTRRKGKGYGSRSRRCLCIEPKTKASI